MAHATAQVPIIDAAAALGMCVSGCSAHCFNTDAHEGKSDRKPSLAFLTGVNRFKCYACGAAGDVIDLVRAVSGVGFAEATRWLTRFSGGVPVNLPSPKTPPVMGHTPSACDKSIYAHLVGLCDRPSQHSPAGQYLLGRGIDPGAIDPQLVAEMASPQEMWGRLRSQFGTEELAAAGLVSRKGNFLFAYHPLLFVYANDGGPVYLQGRDITGQSRCKELCLGAGLHSPIPFNGAILNGGLDRVLVCEGCIDTLSACQLGYAAVGVPGAVAFRREWFPLFRGVGYVTVLFDNDDAGQRQSRELRSQFLIRGIRADSKIPAEGKDLNELLVSMSRKE